MSKKIQFYRWPVWLLIFVFLLVACGGEEPTPTPLPTNTPPPTNTPAPTNTPVPTDTPTPVPTDTPVPTPTTSPTEGFATFESPTAGLMMMYPAEWANQEAFGFIFFATDASLIDEGPQAGSEGALVLVVMLNEGDIESLEPTEALTGMIAEFDLTEEETVLDGPTAVTVNGQAGAVATIQGKTDEGEDLFANVGFVTNEGRGAFFMGVTPMETAETYAPIFEAMFNSMEITAISGAEVAPETAVPQPEGILLYGDTVEGEITDNQPDAWSFVALAGESIDIIVQPLSDELDVVVDVLNENGVSLLPQPVDEAFETEEIRDLSLPANGTYFIVISGFAGSTGPYRLTLDMAGARTGIEGNITYGDRVEGSIDFEDEESTWTFFGLAGDWVDITVVPLDEELDLVVDVQDMAGNSILPLGPKDDSFDTEFIRALLLPEDGEYAIVVTGFAGGTGPYGLALDLTNDGLPGSLLFAGGTLDSAEEAHVFPFTALAGERATIYVDPELELDVIVALYNDDTDELLQEVDDTSGFEEITFEVPEDGNYYFEVRPFEGTAGSYEATVVATDFVLLEIIGGDAIFGRLGDDGIIEYIYAPAPGTTVTFDVEPNDETGDYAIEILDADDNIIATADANGTGGAESLTYTFTNMTEGDLFFLRVSNLQGAGGEFWLFVEE